MSSLTIHIHRIFYISEKGTKRLSKKFHVTSTNHMKLQEQFRTPKKRVKTTFVLHVYYRQYNLFAITQQRNTLVIACSKRTLGPNIRWATSFFCTVFFFFFGICSLVWLWLKIACFDRCLVHFLDFECLN